MQIAHDIFSGPLEVECFHHLHGLFELVTACYKDEFAVPGLLEYSIHGSVSVGLGD